MNVPSDLRYTDQHEWARQDGEEVVVGITDHAQELLGDLVFVDLPAEGATFAKGEEALAVESTKAAASIYAPVGGTVTAANARLVGEPGLVNSDCYGEGWLIRLRPNDAAELNSLMDAGAYEQFLGTLSED